MPVRFGLQLDMDQLRLKGTSISALGPALVLAMLSFATGFESATTLGAEARDPLRTIPRVVLQSAMLSGAFFMLCSYCEVLGFRGESGKLSESTSPLHLLAAKGGIAPLGVVVDFGALLSMFACVLASITAAARVSMRVANAGLLPAAFERTNRRHGTPGLSIVISAGLMIVSTVTMMACAASTAPTSLIWRARLRFSKLPDGLRIGGRGSALRPARRGSAFASGRCGQHRHGSGHVSDRDLRSAVGDRPRSRADSLHLYPIYLVAGIAWYKMKRKNPAAPVAD